MLYLDIDGVLLGRDEHDVCLARYAKDFLRYALEHFDCYWLTTHCNEGSVAGVVRALKPYCDEEVLELAGQVKATTWKTLKTEVIDLSSDFYWIDDSPLQFEIDYLEANGCIDRWIEIDTRIRPDDLSEAIRMLKAANNT